MSLIRVSAIHRNRPQERQDRYLNTTQICDIALGSEAIEVQVSGGDIIKVTGEPIEDFVGRVNNGVVEPPQPVEREEYIPTLKDICLFAKLNTNLATPEEWCHRFGVRVFEGWPTVIDVATDVMPVLQFVKVLLGCKFEIKG